MRIKQILKVPTGKIIVVEGSKGPLEIVSLGDYGADINLNQHKPIPEGQEIQPLTEKWVITISTQYGCSMGCSFCDVPLVGPGVNATFSDLTGQIQTAMELPCAPPTTKRLNVHFARMGEPTWNGNVHSCAYWLQGLPAPVHPVVSTMMPRLNKGLSDFLWKWMYIKNISYKGEAGLQLSINSTDENERLEMFNGNAHTLADIYRIMYGMVPVGRKITLNFAVANYKVDPDVLIKYFDPEHYIIKLTPMHVTHAAVDAGLQTVGEDPYRRLEEALRRVGYDVLVFIASREEDESRITCGNAILSGTMPYKYERVL